MPHSADGPVVGREPGALGRVDGEIHVRSEFYDVEGWKAGRGVAEKGRLAMALRRRIPPVVAVLLVGVLAMPARAIGAFGPPVTISDPPCEFDGFNADLARGAGEVAHGFVDLWGSNCNAGFVIDYVEGSGATWTREATPYRGFVVAVAWDTTGTYLLYVDAARLELRVTKRLTDGTYTGGRLLSTRVGPDGSGAQGDLVATDGQWWAVWREHVTSNGGPGDEFDQTDLFQAYTIGGALHGRQRITTNPAWDSAPTLARTPAGTFPLTLVWARGGSDFGGSAADLRRALGNAAGGWSSSTLATAGFLNFWPDVQVVGTTTHVTWNRDGRTVAADNGGGGFASHTFRTTASQSNRPRLGVSAGNVVVGWTTLAAPARAFVASRVGGAWTGAYASPASATRQQLLQGVAPTGGKATAVILSVGSRLYATNEA
jgi:hypothetical protein